MGKIELEADGLRILFDDMVFSTNFFEDVEVIIDGASKDATVAAFTNDFVFTKAGLPLC